MVARACGKSNVHDLEAEDLRALSLEAAIMSGCPLVGTEVNLRSVVKNLGAVSDQLSALSLNGQGVAASGHASTPAANGHGVGV